MPSNDHRANWAHNALITFATDVGTTIGDDDDCADAIADLICDLGHYADRRKLDHKNLIERAAGMWSAERRDPEGDPRDNDVAELTIVELPVAEKAS